MGRKMNRGKRAILFEYLPGKTYDFERTGVIARTTQIRSKLNTDLNLQLVLTAVEKAVKAWNPNCRLLFPVPLMTKANSFVLVEPISVSAEMFPMIFWCQNERCGRIYDRSRQGTPSSTLCPVCKNGRLIQLRFIQIHRCGALLPLNFYCLKCKSSANMSLNTRDSERIRGFQTVCRKCGTTSGVFGRFCPECSWEYPIPNVRRPKSMDIVVHRAGNTFYPHSVTLLNQPGRDLSAFLDIAEWAEVTAASYLEFPEMRDKRLLDLTRYAKTEPSTDTGFELTAKDVADLKARGFNDIQIANFIEMQAQLQPKKIQASKISEPSRIADSLIERTGVRREIWSQAGQDMLEVVLPMQTGDVKQLFDDTESEMEKGRRVAEQLGLSRVSLIADFPITTAVYGYSRVDYQPGRCFVNPFPPDRDQGSKFPIFIDMVQADAIMLRLDANRVCRWLEANGLKIILPKGSGSETLRQQAYFVELFNDVLLAQTIRKDNTHARMVFGLLHSLGHLCVRRAALLCGLDRTSLSEYLLPRSLSFAVYSSHRFGQTIGALTALFEQSLTEWLSQVRDSRRCVYDPVCADQGGNCHACMHLSEIGCQFFNLNLGRSFLFGGRDPEMDNVEVGYLDFSVLGS